MFVDETWARILAPSRSIRWNEFIEGGVLWDDTRVQFLAVLQTANAYDIHMLDSIYGIKDSWMPHIQPEALPLEIGDAPITRAARDAVFHGRYDFTYEPVKQLMCELLRAETYEDHGIDITYEDVLRMISAGLPLFPRDRFGCPLWVTFIHRDDLAELICFVHLIYGDKCKDRDVLIRVRSFM